MSQRSAFSLVEVTLALGVIAFALIAILGLIPVGLSSARDATEDTRVSLIAQDVAVRARALFGPASAASPATNWFFDSEGRFIDQSGGANYGNAFFRATVTSGDLSAQPANVSGDVLRGVKVAVGWPVNPADGTIAPATNQARATFSLYLRRP